LVRDVAGVKLRVLSYNLHGFRDDRSALTGLIRALAPDVVIAQEGPRRFRWRRKIAAFADDCGMVFGAGGLPALGNLLLVTLRVQVHETSCLRYPLTPGRHLRGAVFARCSVRGAAFSVSGSHLATDPVERPAQAARWKSALDVLDGPLIAGGDLNEGPDGESWRTVANGLETPAAAAPTYPARQPRRRLDAVFTSPDISVQTYDVIDSDQARAASDHLPVLADLWLPSS
jgi:endonuclease/exonuclease/phosphatase family metal-dependent hydrolase